MLAYLGALQLGLLYALLTLGGYITFRILNTPDLTADGSFTLGMAVAGVFTAAGHPLLGILMALPAGALAGTITGFLQTKAGIHPVLSGILVMFGLQSINLFIMGAPNISLLGRETVFTMVQGALPVLSPIAVKTLLPLAVCIAAVCLLRAFFATQLGLSIRATGDNEDMVRASSINVGVVKTIGFALANALIALAGALLAQYQGSADINAGAGVVTIGLASVIIGELFFGRRGLTLGFISAAVGAAVYRVVLALALQMRVPAHAFKLLSAVIIGVALGIPAIKRALALQKAKRGGGRHAAD